LPAILQQGYGLAHACYTAPAGRAAKDVHPKAMQNGPDHCSVAMMTDKHVDTDCVAGVHGSCLHPEHRHQDKPLMPERGYDDTSSCKRSEMYFPVQLPPCRAKRYYQVGAKQPA
jgi:hypothetical protein